MTYLYFLKSHFAKILIAIYCFATIIEVKAQCGAGTLGGALSPVPSAAYQTMNVTTGNYYTFVVAAGCMPTYDFSFCAADGSNAAFDSQITILDNSGAYAGGYSDDFCGLQSHVTWTAPAAGTYSVQVNTFFCSNGSTALLAYKVTVPANMTFSSSTVAQASVAPVTKCDLDQEIISVQVVTSGTCSPMAITQFQLGTGLSTAPSLSDVSKIHIYYTGTTSTFSTTFEFVPGGTVPSGGTNTINGNQTLTSGTNYFWIAYDISPTAVTTNVVDASCSQITVGGINRIPTTTSPAGTRTINTCSAYPVTSALGLKHWVKSDVGITLTGGNVSAWADQSSSAITGSLNQATAANRPSVASSAINFQDYVRFDGTNDILVSANTFAGNSLYNTTDNTVFMIKNYKSGLVDYKWETDPTNSWRIGMELMGSGAQRIDFVDDNGGGKNDLSTTVITNKDVLVGYVSDAGTISLKLNGNTNAVKTHPSLVFNPPAATLKPLNIGANDLGNPLYCNVDIAEVMTYNKKLSSSESRRVESYLALKYGITLYNNQGTGTSIIYMASDGTQIWNNNTAYHNYVIGIGRDNAATSSGLNKLKSTSVASLNGSTDILTIANGASLAAPSAFTADKSFFVAGTNALTLASTTTSILDLPAGIVRRLERVWKGQETGTVTNVRMQFNMSTVPGVGGVLGANDLANVRLLVDADGVFTSGATVVVPSTFNNVTDLVEFQFDFTAGTGFYFTIGSVDASTAPLPVELISYSISCNNNEAKLKWTTASESNNAYYSISRSADAINFELLSTVIGAGSTSNMSHYFYNDIQPLNGTSYYKLTQTDFNGEMRELGVLPYSCNNLENNVNVWINSNGMLSINTNVSGAYVFSIFDITGNLIYKSSIALDSGISNVNGLNGLKCANGAYLVRIQFGEQIVTRKVYFGE